MNVAPLSCQHGAVTAAARRTNDAPSKLTSTSEPGESGTADDDIAAQLVLSRLQSPTASSEPASAACAAEDAPLCGCEMGDAVVDCCSACPYSARLPSLSMHTRRALDCIASCYQVLF